ncbi:hypothetical protein E8E13_001495 [Curvularia kusanoi]|uniref:Major facilitator superfamily (MFS) profile domain-containing protein n=1 Tax=Curvularia kusanoi TaxID=90978 RepID=A0A9P4T5C0_CURKU|nr:hypothetical protein E8E13_001495 [Curvularia kusanoi]
MASKVEESTVNTEVQSGTSDIPDLASIRLSKEARRARRKVDTTVLPLLFLGLLVFQLDRMNLASALTDGFARDIGVNQNTINLGNQLMFLGIVVLEIPSNIILQRLGPRKWISAQVFIFGLVATLQVFVKDKAGFLVARSFLGLCEAGYIPGAIYTLSMWYTKRELAKRVAVFFFGMFGGNAISPVLASGILQLGGERGMKGWKWLFLIEGIFTTVVAIALLFLLPGSPDEPRPLLSPGLIRFEEVDRDALRQHLEADDAEKRYGAQGMHISLSLVWQTVKHYRRWASFVSTFAVFSTWSSLTTYTPSIIMALGFTRVQANALSSVGGFLALGVVFLFVLIVTREAHPSVGKWSRWGLWTAVNAFAIGYHPVHNSWVQLNCKDPRERSISIAMWVMSAISGLMVGTQYYRSDDLPFYDGGLRTQIVMVAVGMIFALAQELVYIVYNRKALRKWKEQGGERPWLYTP